MRLLRSGYSIADGASLGQLRYKMAVKIIDPEVWQTTKIPDVFEDVPGLSSHLSPRTLLRWSAIGRVSALR